MHEGIEEAAAMLASSTRAVVSTGAGISRESGIPTFRDADGLWNSYRPEELATEEGFLANPGLVWRWYMERLSTARDREPNPGHYALADLEKLLPSLLTVTQNIDNLHRRAGISKIVELHGSIERFRCLENSHLHDWNDGWTSDEPPLCHCGSMMRPDVVWFGETLPRDELERAFTEAMNCDVMLVIGTSGIVQPAAQLPWIAKSVGAPVIEINIGRTVLTGMADIFLQGKSGEILPIVAGRVREMLG